MAWSGIDGGATPKRSGGGMNGRNARQQQGQTGGVDVGFSDDLFLKRVLQEAQRSAGSADAVKRLEGHGFPPEVSKIALHVSGGDERRALELCMSGMSFMGAGGMAEGDLMTPEKICPPPAKGSWTCYICGSRHLQQKSLEIHTKACRKRWEQREAKRPPLERRELLEEYELPDGINTLEQYYELAGKRAPEMHSAAEADRRQEKFQEMVNKQQQGVADLLPCEHCGRTFNADRLKKHVSVCMERPRPDPMSPPPKPPSVRRRSGNTTGGGVGEKAYEAFTKSLSRCPGCTRPFRPELLEGHMKQCTAIQAAEEQARAERARQRVPAQRRSMSGSGVSGAAPPRAGKAVPSGNFSPAPRQNAVSPAPRQRDKSPAPSRALPKWAAAPPPSAAAASVTPTPSFTPPVAADEALQSSRALLAKGFIVPALPDDEAMLQAQLAGALPGASFVNAFEVARRPQHAVYEALRMSFQDQYQSLDAEPTFERELWHGTSWAIVGKILRDGFNRSFAGRHGTLLGMATYFSADFSYSHRFCDKRGGGKDGTKVILLCGVLIGRYCKGSPSDIEPPVMDAATGERYDSTTDNEEKPNIFAVFRDFQALPLYVVEFKT
mmetsp:Transcript_90699/g.171052  ORF Transcript_90699/g.171052 Transcript_90699/m.171052 type:complete len:608 (-) Transcript_90699:82-1905(-)